MSGDSTADLITLFGTEYERLAEVGEWDYQWKIGALLRRVSDGALFFTWDSGCSCYGFGTNLSPEEVVPVASPHEAVELSKEEFTDADVAEFAKRVLYP